MNIYTLNSYFLNDGYATLKMPIIKNEVGTWVPKYEALFIDIILRKFYKYHLVQRYYKSHHCDKLHFVFLKSYCDKLHFIFDKLTFKHPQSFRFWIEVTFKLLPETESVIEKLLSNDDVKLIETSEKYKNF